jgi:hypothetical protein
MTLSYGTPHFVGSNCNVYINMQQGGVTSNSQIILKQRFADNRYTVGCYFPSRIHGSAVISRLLHDTAHHDGVSCLEMKLHCLVLAI